MAEKVFLGTLDLDISTVEKKVKQINDELGKLGVGANFDLSKIATDKIGKEIDKLMAQIKKTVSETNESLSNLGKDQTGGALESVIENVTSTVETARSAINKTTGEVETFTTTVVSGFDRAGNKIKEYYNSQGELTKQIIDNDGAIKEMLGLFDQLAQKQAKLYEMEQNGKSGTSAYLKLAGDIDVLNGKLGQYSQYLTNYVKSTQEYADIQKRLASAKNAVDEGVQLKAANAELDSLLSKYERYYDLKSKQINAIHSGNTDLADHYRAEAEALWNEIAATEKNNEALAAAAATHDRVTAAVEKYNNAIRSGEAKGEAFANKAEAEQLKSLVSLYEEYYNARTNAIQSDTKGNEANATLWTNLANSIKIVIDEIAGENAALNENALASKGVADAKREMQAAINNNALKQEQDEARAAEQAIKAYADALAAMIKEQANLNNAVASGRIAEGSEEYNAAEAAIKRLEAAAIQAGQKLDETGRSNAMSMANVKAALDDLAQSEGKLNDQEQVTYLDLAQAAYKNLTNAITQYNAAKKAGDTESMAYWQNQIDASATIISTIGGIVGELHIEETERSKILDLVHQAQTAQMGMNKTQGESATLVGQWSTQLGSMIARYTSILTIIRGIKTVLSEAVEYVSKFHDQMNEIQMITGKSDTEISQLADNYRGLASEMSVSSTQMAEAAIYFTRQGLQTEEIEDRLRNTTQYAKAANIEFTTAAELITAVVNSMNLAEEATDGERSAAQRVADVFMAVGDSAATSGEEIGTAMQKAAAAAGAFGVDFEWLASYIATVSETTRQEASTIGTAFNTLIARLHSIRTTGYNQEDETKINDIAKALNTINVALLDQEGNWRDMTDIFNDIASQWDGLSGKQQSYIATTMAGVKQQNTFLALMEDLSKGVEGGSRAWELYSVAMDSAGTAADKYAVFLDSVAASQNRLTIAQENFYSMLDVNIIKDWNNVMAEFLNSFTNLSKTPYERFSQEFTDALSQVDNARKAQGIIDEIYSDFGGAIGLMSTPTSEYIGKLETISSISPRVAAAVQQLKDGVISQSDAFRIINQELENYLASMQQMTAGKILDKYKDIFMEGPTTSSGQLERYGFDMSDPLSFYKAIEDFYGDVRTNGYLTAGLFASPEQKAGNTLYKQIKEVIDSLEKDVQNLDSSDWQIIGDTLWSKLFEGFGSSAEEYARKNQGLLSELINDIILTYDDGSDPVVTKAFERYMESIFTDSNGNIIAEGFAGRLQWLLADIMRYGFSSVIPETDIAELIAESLFDSDALYEMFETEGNDFAKAFIDGYRQLIEAGFSDAEIGQIISEAEIPTTGIDALAEQVKNYMLYSFSQTILEGYGGLENLFNWNDKWAELDLSHLKMISDVMQQTGTDIQTIDEILYESTSIDDFVERLQKLTKASEDLPEGGEDVVDWAKELKESLQDFDDLDKALANLKDGKAVSTDDLLNLADAHPEIYQVINDAEKLAIVLETLRAKAKANTIDTLANQLLNDEKWFSRSQWFTQITDNVKTGQQYMDTLEEGSDEWLAVRNAAMAAAQALYGYNEAAEKTEETSYNAADAIKDMADKITNSNKEIGMLESALETLNSKKNLSLSDVLDIAQLHPEIMSAIGDTDQLKEALQQLKEEAQNDIGESVFDFFANDEATMAESPFAESGYKTLQEYLDSMSESPGAMIQNAEEIQKVTKYLDTAAENVLNATKEMEEATETWLEAQAQAAKDDADANWAKSNNYVEQISQMQRAFAEGGAEEALKTFNGYSDAIKQGIASTFPNLVRSLAQAETAQGKLSKATDGGKHSIKELNDAMDESAKTTEQLGTELGKAEKYVKANYFKSTAKAIKDLEEGTISATDAYEVFNKECSKVTEAGDEIVKAEKKLSQNTDLVTDDVSALAEVLGVSAQTIIDDFPGAEDVFNQLIAKGGAMEAMFNALNEAAFIRITGTSVADFSALQNGLLSVEGLAEEVIEMLVKTGQWKLTTLDLPQEGYVLDPTEGWITSTVEAHATVLEPTGANPFGDGITDNTNKKSSGGGGGGGGGGDSSNYTYVDPTVTHNAEEAMERITRVLGIQKEAFEDAAKSSRFYGMSIAEMMQSMYNGNVDLLARPLVDAAELVKKGWEDAGEGIATVFSTTYEHQIEDVYFGINLTPILPNGEVLTEEELNDYFDELVDGATSMSDILSRDAAENGGMNLVINIVEAESMDEAIDHAVELAEELHELQEEYYLTEDATEDMTDATENMTEATDEAANVVPALTVKLKSLGQSVNYTTEQLNDMAKAISELSNADLIDIMERVQTIIGYQQGYYQAKQSYYEQTGQMQGYIAYLDEERELLEEQNEALKDNIAALEVKMEATETALNGMSKEDEGYQDLKEDLEKLQDTHASYTQTVIENDTAILKLAEDAKDAADEIRQMEIDIKQLIYDAIEDREEKIKSMRDARISMEDSILDVIKANYEKEKDAIIKNTETQLTALSREKDAIKDNYDAQIDAIKDEKDDYKDMMDDRIDALKEEKDAYSDMMAERIAALNEEKSLLQDQLNLRKEQNNEQDKQAQLEQLEVQYQQILADPTRAKEAQSIKSKIDKLRDEISWSDAEKAVKAQQTRIEDQVEALTAEKSKTLEQMDDEIKSIEEIRDATVKAMEDQVEALEDQRDAQVNSIEDQINALNDYKDYIEDFYDDLLDNSAQIMSEMANVMEMTDDEIIEWLKQNDETYAKASASTQEKMEEEWRDTLDEMHGNVQTYWDEVEEIFQQGDEAIIEFLKENSAEYAEAGQLQAEAYVDEWKEKLEELRLAYEDVAGEIQQAPNYNTYVDTPTNSGESGEDSGSGGGGGGGGGGQKWHVSMAPNMTFNSEDEAKAYKTKMTNLAWNDWEADGEDSNLYNRYLQWSNSTVAKYIKGGLAKNTGLAWLDGTPEDPERVLSPYQTQLFETMVRALESAVMAPTYKMHNYGEWAAENEGSTSATFGDIIVNVDNLDTDDDYEELAEKVGDVLLEKIGETTVVGGIRLGRY